MTASFLAYCVIMSVIVLGALGVIGYGILQARTATNSYDHEDSRWFIYGGAAVVIIASVISVFALYPYKAEYHSWRVHSGVVDKISSRLVSAGDKGGTDQKFVVVFRGSTQPYGVVDTRASLVKPGDPLRITCIRRHQWGGGVDGYDCRWDQ